MAPGLCPFSSLPQINFNNRYLIFQVTLNKRKKGLIKKAMEISLLTGVHLVLTIFDKEEGKIIQYLSDSMEKFQAINKLEDIELRKRYVKESRKTESPKEPNNEDDAGTETEPINQDGAGDVPKQPAPAQYIPHKIISEIYTNDHVSL